MKIITQGLSRLVFIYGDYAIKISWINIPRMILCLLQDKKDGVFNEKAKRFGKNKILAIPNYLFHILSSNRREYLYFKKHKDEEVLLPIVKAFLFVYIIIQPKGNVFNSSNPRWIQFVNKIIQRGMNHVDFLKPENYCEFNGLIKMLDHGNDQTQKVLDFRGFIVIKNDPS
jgi:hypothetical protein